MNNDAEIYQWLKDLAEHGYYADRQICIALEDWWQSCQGPLIAEGFPGTGKSRLGILVAKIKQASFYRLPCMEDVGRREALYTWNKVLQKFYMKQALKDAQKRGQPLSDPKTVIYRRETILPGALVQALQDPNKNVVLLIDELDKAPRNKAFEAMLLEFLEESAITIPETGERITPASGVPPRTFITSNAGTNGQVDSLSIPVLRRGRYLWLPEATRLRQYLILKQEVPHLSDSVVREIALFLDLLMVQRQIGLEKHITISEAIMWARALQRRRVNKLTDTVIVETLFALSKNTEDSNRLCGNARYLLSLVDKQMGVFIKELSVAGVGLNEAA
ncbi:MAG: MoxR family ATPase [Acidobacteriota bacterium]